VNKKLLFSFLLVMLVTACGSSGELSIRDAWTRPASAGENGAAYFVIENGTASEDTLLSATSDVATATELHMSMAHDNGIMSMEKQESVSVPARSNVEFKPGGLHVMLIGLKENVEVGDTITLTLSLEKAGSIVVQVPVQAP
jgi:copper(I)-binding protein